MRYRLMATYRGVPYEAGVGPSDTDVTLFAACPPPEDLGFQPATGHWRKAVSRAEVDGLWESRPSGMFRGQPCLVLEDLGDQLHISYVGHDPFAAADLGYAELEPGVFEVITGREEVTSITEERVQYAYPNWPPASAAGTSGPEPSGPEPSGPEPSGPEPSGPESSGPESSGAGPFGPESSGPGPSGPGLGAGLVLRPGDVSGSGSGDVPGLGLEPGREWGTGLGSGTGLEQGPRLGQEPGFGLDPGLGLEEGLGDALAAGLTGDLATGLPRADLRVPYARSTGKKRDISGPPEAAPAPPTPAHGQAEPPAQEQPGLPVREQLGLPVREQPGLPVRGQAETLVPAQAGLPVREQGALPVRDPSGLPGHEGTGLLVSGPAEPPAPGQVELPRRGPGGPAGRRTAGRSTGRRARAGAQPPRAKARQTFTELLELAAVPADDYALDEIVDGALCLIRADDGFEVFSAADGVRQEVRFFEDEETAYFYLFGLLTAEAVRDGRLTPPR